MKKADLFLPFFVFAIFCFATGCRGEEQATPPNESSQATTTNARTGESDRSAWMKPPAGTAGPRGCRSKPSDGCFLYVPGGTYLQGAQNKDPNAPGYDANATDEEGPVKTVTVAPFWIQRHEVTARHFVECVQSRGACIERHTASGEQVYNHLVEEKADHPINGITLEGAKRYCEWLGAKLPSEAEWELAARSTDGRRFPWGDKVRCGDSDNQDEASDCRETETRAVDDLVTESPYGLVGMSNNVSEWVLVEGAAENDEMGIVRGGNFSDASVWSQRTTLRRKTTASAHNPTVGFRCVWLDKRDTVPTKGAQPSSGSPVDPNSPEKDSIKPKDGSLETNSVKPSQDTTNPSSIHQRDESADEDNTLNSPVPPNPTTPKTYSIRPGVMQFFANEERPSDSQALQIHNKGNVPLVVKEVTLLPAETSLMLDQSLSVPFTLAPDEKQKLSVICTDTTKVTTARLTLITSAETQYVDINITGIAPSEPPGKRGGEPDSPVVDAEPKEAKPKKTEEEEFGYKVRPYTMQFFKDEEKKSASQNLTIHNTSKSTLHITGLKIQPEGGAFALDNPPTLPLKIKSKKKGSFQILCSDTHTSGNATLLISTKNGERSIRIKSTGTPAPNPPKNTDEKSPAPQKSEKAKPEANPNPTPVSPDKPPAK